MQPKHSRPSLKVPYDHFSHVLLTSKKWRLQREGRQSRRQGV